MSGASEALTRTRLAGVVLAAGAAARFGTPKQLAPFQGETLVLRAVRQAVPNCLAGVFVVTGAANTAVSSALSGQRVSIVHNAAWESGMASSIRCGLLHLPAAAQAALLLLCDQPAITGDDLGRMVFAWESAPDLIVAARYGGSRGVPAIFPRSCWPGLLTLKGDQGARELLRGTAAVTEVELPRAALDVDTPEDLAALAGCPPQR